jgi:raffinose/stachyose/melibiose transport system substrate-binding protein
MEKIEMKTLSTLVACALTATSVAAADVTLNLWTWFPSEDVLNKTIDSFEANNPGVDIKLNLFESSAYQDRMPLALASGDPMDIVAVQTSTMVNLVKSGLEPLSPLFDQHASGSIDSLLSSSALSQAKQLADDGELYIAPMGVLGSAAVYYNADMLDEMGLDVPRTKAEMAAFVKAVETKRPDLLAYSFTGANWFLDEITLTIAEQANPGFFNSVRYEQGGQWDGKEYKMAFDAIVDLYKDGIFSKDTLDLDYGRSAELFQTEKAVAFIQGTWESGILSAPFRESKGITLDNVVATGLPVVVSGGKPSIRSYIEVGLAVPQHSKNKAIATKFIEHMTAGDGVKDWSDTLFVVPAMNNFELAEGIFNTKASEESYAEIAELLLNPGSDRSNISDFSAALGDIIIESIVSGTATDKQLKRAQREWDSGRYSNAN